VNNAADYVNNSIPYKVYNEKFTVNPKELEINPALRPTPILLIKNFLKILKRNSWASCWLPGTHTDWYCS